jgi:ribA/ribD-fused uncharacterized protein
MHIREFIVKNYPEYYSIERYPKDRTAPFCSIDQSWGILSNFGRTPLVVDGVTFDCAEKLYQIMKFTDSMSRKTIFSFKGQRIKFTAKKLEKVGTVRPDWGEIIVDAMKFCLMEKYRQSEAFREELERTRGLYIVEDQTTFRKKDPDTWGVKPSEDGKEFVGPNLMGRLLMELRDNGRLDYSLPEDVLSFQDLASL